MKKDQEIFIAQQISELRGKVIEGFGGVNKRLDTLNGKVAEHERRLNGDDLMHAEEKGERKGISTVWKIVVTIMSIVIGILSYMAVIHPH